MSLLLTFMELDKLYEYCGGTKDLDEHALAIKDLRAFYETSTTIDKELYPNFHAWYDAQVKAGKYKLEAFDANEDKVVEGIFSKKKLVSADDGLAEPTALATETEYDDISVVDLVKRAYENGMFDQLPVGRKNALMLDIYGVDKERLAGYFKKQPEFAYEVNRDSGIISHEFISDKYDVEVFDSFISMYRIPQNESLSEAIINNKETEDMNFQTILEELDRIYEEDAKAVEADVALEEDADDEMVVVDDDADEAPVEDADEEPVEGADEAEEQDEVAAQQVLKCANCGALVIKAVDEVVVDEESGNVNVDESCEFCEETAGYEVLGAFIPADEEPVQESLMEGKIADSLKKVGTRLGADASTIIRAISEVLPDQIYDVMAHVENKAVLKALESGNEKVLNTCTIEDLEDIKADIEQYEKEKAEKKAAKNESADTATTDAGEEELTEIFGFGKNKKKSGSSAGGNSSSNEPTTVSFKVWDKNGTLQFSGNYEEFPGKKSAAEQFKDEFMERTSVYNNFKKNSPTDWTYERKSNPPSPLDSTRYKNILLAADLHMPW